MGHRGTGGWGGARAATPQGVPAGAPRCGGEVCPGDGWLAAPTPAPPGPRPMPRGAEPGQPPEHQPPSSQAGPRCQGVTDCPSKGLARAQDTFPESSLSSWLRPPCVAAAAGRPDLGWPAPRGRCPHALDALLQLRGKGRAWSPWAGPGPPRAPPEATANPTHGEKTPRGLVPVPKLSPLPLRALSPGAHLGLAARPGHANHTHSSVHHPPQAGRTRAAGTTRRPREQRLRACGSHSAMQTAQRAAGRQGDARGQSMGQAPAGGGMARGQRPWARSGHPGR